METYLFQSGGVFKVQPNGNPSPSGNLVHTLDLKGNLTHNGSSLDFRSGSAGTTLGVCNLMLSGIRTSIMMFLPLIVQLTAILMP